MALIPTPYNIDDPEDIRRLHRELCGYMRVSLTDGTDHPGRALALEALEKIVAREEGGGKTQWKALEKEK